MKYITPDREMPIKLTSNDYYREVIDIVEDWSNKNYYDGMIVCLSVDGEKTNELLLIGAMGEYLFEIDWWEGQKDVYLLGFTPISDLEIQGWPSDVGSN